MTHDSIHTCSYSCERPACIKAQRDELVQKLPKLVAEAVAADREKVAAWMRSKSYATGHGDTTEDLLKELEWQVAEREREACAKVCEKMADNIYSNSHEDSQPMPHAVAKFCAAAIRARGET